VQRHKCRTERDGDYKEKKISRTDRNFRYNCTHRESAKFKVIYLVMTAKAWYFRYDVRSVAMNDYIGTDDSAGFSWRSISLFMDWTATGWPLMQTRAVQLKYVLQW